MNERTGEWHVIWIERPDHPDDWDPQVLHPNSCGITYTDGFGLQRICEVQHELDNVGFDTLFGDEHPTGWFRVRHSIRVIPGTPYNSGWSEYETEWEVEELTT